MAYPNFKSYIQDKYESRLTASIEEFINLKHDGLGFHAYNVLSLCDQKIENLNIKYMVCHDDIGPMITMDIHCEADLVTMSLGINKTVAARKTMWFTVYAQAILANGLKDFAVINVDEYNPDTFEKPGALDEYLVPYIYSDQLEDEAEDFYNFYCAGAVFHEGWTLPVGQILGEMGIEYYEAPLPDGVFGRMYFNPSFEDVYEYDSYMIQRLKGKKERRLVNKEIKAGTMLINEKSNFMGDVGSGLNTIAHEIIHWEKHQKFFEILSLLNDDETNLECAAEPEMSPEHLEGVQKAIWWAEWQANVLAPRILMPRTVFIELFKQIYIEQSEIPYFQSGDIMERTLDSLGMCFGVSKYAAKTRAIQLGIDTADGAFIFVDGEYYYPLNYPAGTLGKNQTFIIDRASANKLIADDDRIRELVEKGLIVYTGCVFCVNDEKYVVESKDPRHDIELSQYALEHADECCLIFDRVYQRSEHSQEVALYSLFYLSKEVTASAYVEAHYNPNFKNNQSVEKIAEELAKIRKQWEKQACIEAEMPDDFAGTLKYHMERKGISIYDLEDRTDLSHTIIKNYRSGSKEPSLESLMAIFVGLNLKEDYCDDMLDKLGRKLRNDDKGRIYRMLIHEHSDGDLEQWNRILEAAGYDKIPKK